MYPSQPHALSNKLFQSPHNYVTATVKELSEIFWPAFRPWTCDLKQLLHNFKSHAPLQIIANFFPGLVPYLPKPSLIWMWWRLLECDRRIATWIVLTFPCHRILQWAIRGLSRNGHWVVTGFLDCHFIEWISNWMWWWNSIWTPFYHVVWHVCVGLSVAYPKLAEQMMHGAFG